MRHSNTMTPYPTIPPATAAPSYCSISQLESEGTSAVPSFSIQGGTPPCVAQTTSGIVSYRKRHLSNFRSVTILAVLATVVLVGVTFGGNIGASQEEMDIAYDNDLHPWWGGISAIRSAQRDADAAMASLVDMTTLDLHDLVKDIKKDKVETPELEQGCEATVMILRHCEKGDIKEHCNYVGYERSAFLSTQFGDEDTDRWPSPSFLFAEGTGGRNRKFKANYREIETLGPLAKKAGVLVDDSYDTDTADTLAKDLTKLIGSGDMCGKVAVIAWKHSNIPHLARHLGCGPAQGCPTDWKGKHFDDVWQIKFAYRRPGHSTHKSLKNSHKLQWLIFGSVNHQFFDPLAYSKSWGDYPQGGTPKGGRWSSEATILGDRKNKTEKPWESVDRPPFMIP